MTQPTDPVCYRHPSRVTYLRCSRCDRPICPHCTHHAAVGQHCPECSGAGRRVGLGLAGRRSPTTARTAFGGTLAGQQGHVVMTLITLNVLVAAVTFVVGGTQAAVGGGWGGLLGGTTPVHLWGGMQTGPVVYAEIASSDGYYIGVGGVAEGDYYRLLTSMFLHYGVFHLLLNMWALWVVGGVLEPLLGRARFLALYLVSGLGGGVATYLFEEQLIPGVQAGGVTAGASGAVFGLFAAFYIVLRRLGRDTSMITMILVINLILTFTISNISIWGHLGGMVTGGLIALALAYAPRQHRTAIQVTAIAGVVVLLAGLTILRTLQLG